MTATIHHTTCPGEKKRSAAETIVHLAAAPQHMARTRFSPPPSRAPSLNISEAMEYLAMRMAESDTVKMAAITGPGDPLATPELTLELAGRIRERYPHLSIGLLTLGLGGAGMAGDLARAGVNYVEMRIEGIRSDAVEKIYAWIRPGAKTIKLAEGAALLIQEQRNGVSALRFHGIKVTVLTTLYPGYNIDHVARISSGMLELGADAMALVPHLSAPETEVALSSPSVEEVARAKAAAKRHLPVVESLFHSTQLHNTAGEDTAAQRIPAPTRQRPYVAVASSGGIDVDLHLGHASRFLIYGRRSDGLACLLETRPAPKPGTGDRRWLEVAGLLTDCSVLISAGAGEKPRRILAEQGLRVCISEDNIEGLVDVLYGGAKKKKNGK